MRAVNPSPLGGIDLLVEWGFSDGMKKALSFAVAATLVASAGMAQVRIESPGIVQERIVPQSQLARDVVVRDVEARGGTVSGTVVNTSGKVLKDVRLMIDHMWLWENEYHPGTNDPSRVEYFTIREEIPPGGQARFTFRSEAPLPEARGGHFETLVRVASVVSYEPTAAAPAAPPSSPTAGSPMPGSGAVIDR